MIKLPIFDANLLILKLIILLKPTAFERTTN